MKMCNAIRFLAHVAFLLGMLILVLMLYTAFTAEPPAQGRALEGKELEDFMAIRDKHFHRGEASIVICEEGKDSYFIRDGKKCTFK